MGFVKGWYDLLRVQLNNTYVEKEDGIMTNYDKNEIALPETIDFAAFIKM